MIFQGSCVPVYKSLKRVVRFVVDLARKEEMHGAVVQTYPG